VNLGDGFEHRGIRVIDPENTVLDVMISRASIWKAS